VKHPLKALRVWLKGPRTDGPMAPDIALDNQRPAQFVFEDLVKTLSERRAESKAKARTGERSDAA